MKTIAVILFTTLFIKCASVTSEEKTPFIITKASYKESIKEIKVIINYTSEDTVNFIELFFKDRITNITKINNNSLSATFNKLENVNIQLHGDSKKEFGNTSYALTAKAPFSLKENEAAIWYNDKGGKKYFIIKITKEIL